MIHVIATDLVNVDKVKLPFRQEKTKRDKWPWVLSTHPIDPLWLRPEMRHTTTPTRRAPLNRAYDTHFKCPRYPPTHPFPRAPETPERGIS